MDVVFSDDSQRGFGSTVVLVQGVTGPPSAEVAMCNRVAAR
jgi:hypothetical protein